MNPLIAERKRKIEDMKSFGVEPYAKKFARTHFSTEAKEDVPLRDITEIQEKTNSENTISLSGRLMLFRSMGRLAFATIQDEKGKIQICFQKGAFDVEGLDEEKKSPMKFAEKLMDLGDFIGVSGEMFLTKHGEKTLFVHHLAFLSKSLRPLPEKWHGITGQEQCYRERNLDLLSNKETFDRFVLRSKMIQEIRHFFEEKNFLEVETAILQGQAGGAMAKVFHTHHNALDHEFVLRIALELDLKRAVGGGMERVFEIGKNFRNEGTDPSHLQEFTMCEWYAAYQDLETNKKWTEELFHRLTENVFGKKVFSVVDAEGKRTEIDFGGKFAEKSFPELLKEYADLDMFTATDDEIREKAKVLGVEKITGVGRGNLLDDIYKKTARPQLIQPTFVYNYPEELKPLAAPNGDGTASCFQLVVNSWEVVNSYGELIDPQVQRKLLEEQSAAKKGGDDEAMEVDEVFLKAMEHGFPPMTGSGFGIDRLAAIFTGQPNLRDVVLFPTMKPEKMEKKKEEYKIAVAIMNEEANLEKWQEMNTVAHLSSAFAARHKKSTDLFAYNTVQTADKKDITLNIQHAIMIKSADSGKTIKNLLEKAKKENIEAAEFTREMLETTDDKVVKEKTLEKNFDEVEHLGILLFGKKKEVEKLTKEFPLLS